MSMSISNETLNDDTVNGLALGDDELLMIATHAERRVEAVKTIMSCALRMTNHMDWVNIGGEFYLMETGAAKIAAVLKLGWQIDMPIKTYDPDGSGHYTYSTSGRFTFSGRETEAMGLRSTREEFFIGSANATMMLPDGTRVSKPQKRPQDVDERDVMQAAYTNCLNNGIKRTVPGLRRVEPEHLTAAGIDVSRIKGYGFNSGNQAAMSKEATDQKGEIERMLREMCGDAKWTAGLEKITTFTGKDGGIVRGKSDINKLSEKQVSVTYGKVKTEYEKWVKEHGRQTDSEKAVGNGASEG